MSIALSIGNNLTTGGVFTADAVNNTSVTNVTDFASVPGGGALKLLSTQTASASASLEFTSGIDSTYDSYVFKFIDIHSSTSGHLTFQVSTNGGTSYGVTCTTSSLYAYNDEATGTSNSFSYNTSEDLNQSTSFQRLAKDTGGSDADANTAGSLVLYNPSSTTFVKHFMSETNSLNGGYSQKEIYAGYFDTTSAVNAVKFQMGSGNIDDGIIKMYGVV